MKIQDDPFAKLLMHLLGIPPALPSTWLAKSERPCLGFSGAGVIQNPDGCTLNLDPVVLTTGSPHTVRVENLGQEAVTVTVPETRDQVRLRWHNGFQMATLDLGGGWAELEIELVETPHGGLPEAVTLLAEAPESHHSFRLALRLGPDGLCPFGRYDFNGSRHPRPYDFGTSSPVTSNAGHYTLSAVSLTRHPLRLKISELPAWLEMETGGRARKGPISGPFFEQATPLAVVFRLAPDETTLGRQRARLWIETDDPRPEYQRFTLELSAAFEVAGPCLRVATPPHLTLARPSLHPLAIELINLGRQPAQLTLIEKSTEIATGYLPLVPAATSSPGRASVEVIVDSETLAPGLHELFIELQVEHQEPAKLRVPLQIKCLTVSIVPPVVDFGRLAAGRARAVIVRLRSADQPLHPIVSVSARAVAFLSAEPLAHQRLRVLCQPPIDCRPGVYDDLSVVVSDPRIAYEQHIPVRLRVVSPASRRRLQIAAVALALLLLLLVLGLLLEVARSETSSAPGSDQPTSPPIAIASSISSALFLPAWVIMLVMSMRQEKT